MFREVTASSLIKLNLDGEAVDEDQNLNAAGFAIHSAVLQARPDVHAVVHIHTEAGMAISAHEHGLRYITQAAMRFYKRIGYHNYEGMSEIEEREAIARDLGNHFALILHNHSLLTCGTSMQDAMSRMNYLMSAIKSQLMLEATGAEIITPPELVCELAAQQWDEYGRVGSPAEWPAMLRWADDLDPSYKT